MNNLSLHNDEEDIRTRISRQLASLWSWIFLIDLLVIFELWARVSDGSSFAFNAYNVQSLLVFAASTLLLVRGKTLGLMPAGIALSDGF